MATSHWSYDAIAEVYATDMGQSMPFDDVACYARLARRFPGPVLELGCGTGRILLELLIQGSDAIGVDRSLPMLQRLRRDAEQRSLDPPRVAQMDLRALALSGRFALILAPYSLITYLTDAAELDAFMVAARGLLSSSGALVLDAFVPRDVTPFDDFRLDYRRVHGDGCLERAKRIACLPDGRNRIERRYRVMDIQDAIGEEFVTVDCIRPYSPDDLRQLAARHELVPAEQIWDYGADDDPGTARFYTCAFARS
ncbi:MAG: class I SAM-dependent methyltransferase [Arenimonas sp.]